MMLLPTRFTSATCAALVRGNPYVPGIANVHLQHCSRSVHSDISSPLYFPFLRLPRDVFSLLCLLSTDYLYPQLSQTQRTLGST